MCAPPSSHKGPTQLHILWRWGWVYLASCLHRIASTLAREPARNARKHCAFLVEVTHRRPQHATCVQVFWPQFSDRTPYQVTPQLETVPDVAPPLFSKLLSLRRVYFPLPSYVRTRSGPNAGGLHSDSEPRISLANPS